MCVHESANSREDEIQYLINECEKYLSPSLRVRRRCSPWTSAFGFPFSPECPSEEMSCPHGMAFGHSVVTPTPKTKVPPLGTMWQLGETCRERGSVTAPWPPVRL